MLPVKDWSFLVLLLMLDLVQYIQSWVPLMRNTTRNGSGESAKTLPEPFFLFVCEKILLFNLNHFHHLVDRQVPAWILPALFLIEFGSTSPCKRCFSFPLGK